MPCTVSVTNRMGMAFNAKAREVVDALNMDTLLLHHLCGQQGIKAPGNQGNGFWLSLTSGHACECYGTLVALPSQDAGRISYSINPAADSDRFNTAKQDLIGPVTVSDIV